MICIVHNSPIVPSHPIGVVPIDWLWMGNIGDRKCRTYEQFTLRPLRDWHIASLQACMLLGLWGFINRFLYLCFINIYFSCLMFSKLDLIQAVVLIECWCITAVFTLLHLQIQFHSSLLVSKLEVICNLYMILTCKI